MDQYRRFSNISTIKRHNKEAGESWFESGRFFNSRIGQNVYHSAEVFNIFVTSERYDSRYPRLYSVRRLMPDGGVETLSDFQAYPSAAAAKAAIKRFIEDGTPLKKTE